MNKPIIQCQIYKFPIQISLAIGLFVYLFIGLLFKPASAQETLQLQEYSCNASDPAGFKNCIEEVKQTGVPLIKITKPIFCHSREECAFNLSGINTEVTIRPASPENAIFRTLDYSYTLFTIENSSLIKFSDLFIVEENKNICIQGIICPPVVSVKNSSNLLFDRINFKQSHGPSIYISDSKNIIVAGSSFNDGFKTGIEVVSTTGLSESITIQNNLFQNNASSAIIFQAAALPEKKSSIFGNKFDNNHAKGVYINCNFPCTGSQVRILGPTTNLNFSQNTVTGGQNTVFDSVGLYSSGVEIGNRDVSRVSLFCNEISGNRGSGVVESPPFRNMSEIVISENKIWGNGLNLNAPIAKIEENNCYTKECRLSCANR